MSSRTVCANVPLYFYIVTTRFIRLHQHLTNALLAIKLYSFVRVCNGF